MVNYYVEFGLDRGADCETLKTQLAKLRRKWQSRAGSAATLEARQEAEKKMQMIREASAILLVEDERKKYDKELDKNPALANQETSYQNDAPEQAHNTVMDDAAAMDAVIEAYNNSKYNTVFALAEDLVKRKKATDHIYRLLALSYYENGNDAKALSTMERLVADMPENPEARYWAASADLIMFPNRAEEARKNIDWLIKSEEGTSARVAALDVNYFIAIGDLELAAAKTEQYKQSYGSDPEFKKRVGDSYWLYAESMLTSYGGDVYFETKEDFEAWDKYTQMSLAVNPSKEKQEQYVHDKKICSGIKLVKDNLLGVLLGVLLGAFFLYAELPVLGVIFLVASLYTVVFSFPPKWMYHRSLYTGHMDLLYEIAKWVAICISFAFRALIWLIKLIFELFRLIIDAFC